MTTPEKMLEFARTLHAQAEAAGHELVWNTSDASRFVGTCVRCKTYVTLTDDGKDTMELPPAPRACPRRLNLG